MHALLISDKLIIPREVLLQFPSRPQFAIVIVKKLIELYSEDFLSDLVLKEIADYTQLQLPSLKKLVLSIKSKPHSISVCLSPGCGVAGQEAVYQEFENLLNIDNGGYSADGRFVLEYSECPGFCEHSSCFKLNDILYTDIHPEDIQDFLKSFYLKSV